MSARIPKKYQMGRLTVDTIMKAPAFRNTLGERELDLRGLKIPRIENLGATQDQFDVIDFSNNQITEVGDFPILKKCTTLLFNNGIVQVFGLNLPSTLPNLETIMLTNNRIKSFDDLKPLAGCTKLIRLSLHLNPITTLENYRLTIIRMFPNLKYLDFQKISKSERLASQQLFEAKQQ